MVVSIFPLYCLTKNLNSPLLSVDNLYNHEATVQGFPVKSILKAVSTKLLHMHKGEVTYGKVKLSLIMCSF
jgi:hypothetical protein